MIPLLTMSELERLREKGDKGLLLAARLQDPVAVEAMKGVDVPREWAPKDLALLAGLPYAVSELDLSYGPDLKPKDLQSLAKLPGLKKLNLFGYYELSDKHAAELAPLTGLESLKLSSNEIGLKGFAALRGMTSLINLDLYGCGNVTAEVIQSWPDFPRLERLSLGGCYQLRDEGLVEAVSYPTLKELGLANCDLRLVHVLRALPALERLDLSLNDYLGDEAAETVATLTHLVDLDISGWHDLTDKGHKKLGGLSKLTKLNMGTCAKLTGAGFKDAGYLPGLEELYAHQCGALTDKGIAHLAGCSNLKTLVLNECPKLTEAGVLRLSDLKFEYFSAEDCPNISESVVQQLSGES